MHKSITCKFAKIFFTVFLFSLFGLIKAQDVGVTKINAPQSGCNMGSETVQVDVTNFGSNITLATFPISYIIDGGTPVNQNQLFTNFNTNNTQTITFAVPINLSGKYGKHVLKAYTNMSSDTKQSNDTFTLVFYNYKPSYGGILLADDTVCSTANKDTLILTKKTGDVQQWESNTGSGWTPIVNTDTFLTYSNLTKTTSYRVLVKNGLCPTDYSNTVTITVETPPKAGVLENDRTVCAGGKGDTLKLKGYEGTVQKWQLNDGTGWKDISNTDDTLIYPAPTKNTRYRTIIEKKICGPDTSNIVTISVVSVSNGGSIIPNKDTVCYGNNHDTLLLTNSKGDVKQWEYSEDGGFTWVPIINKDTFQIYNNLTTSRKYKVLVEANGCPAVYSDIATITVLQAPEGGFVEKDKSVCGGTNKDTLVLKQFSGSIIKWQSDNGSGWMDIANTNDSLFVSNINKTTRYRAIVGNRSCPNDTSSTATLTVISTTVGGKIIKSDSVCRGSNSDTLVLRGHRGNIRWWERTTDNGVTWTPIANFDTTQRYADLTQTTWYRVLIEGSGCPAKYSDTAKITVYTPFIKTTPGDSIRFCKGDSVMLNSTGGFSNYKWNSGQSTQNIKVFNDGLYKVTGTDKRGCKSSDSIKITVHPLPMADAGMDKTISLGASTKLDGKGGTKYLWKPGKSLSDSTKADPVASPVVTTYYLLRVTDNNGCSDTDGVKITEIRDYNIKGKNIITPNGDGINDTWKIDNIGPYEESTVTIINRYGYKVYEKTGYDNSWDGSNGSERVSDGTYYYIITFSDNDLVIKGHITVLSK